METWHPTHCTKINKILGELEFGFDNDGEKINYINKIIKTDLKNKLEKKFELEEGQIGFDKLKDNIKKLFKKKERTGLF